MFIWQTARYKQKRFFKTCFSLSFNSTEQDAGEQPKLEASSQNSKVKRREGKVIGNEIDEDRVERKSLTLE